VSRSAVGGRLSQGASHSGVWDLQLIVAVGHWVHPGLGPGFFSGLVKGHLNIDCLS
jgi:hypothetical protein